MSDVNYSKNTSLVPLFQIPNLDQVCEEDYVDKKRGGRGKRGKSKFLQEKHDEKTVVSNKIQHKKKKHDKCNKEIINNNDEKTVIDPKKKQKNNLFKKEEQDYRYKNVANRKMIVRQKEDRIQIGIVEDGVLVEHFVSHAQQDSLVGNIYLGKVQNVLPSMEAAFVDIGRGRNAVLYAGEIDWITAGLEGKLKKIEVALEVGRSVLVQVTKDPVNHKGARLTNIISLPGRYLVYIPQSSMIGISRKLPDDERARLKRILKDNIPTLNGVIVRTAAEGVSEEELIHDINRLKLQWENIEKKSIKKSTIAPELLYEEPSLSIKVIRDIFNNNFDELILAGDDAWDTIEAYVTYVAPTLLSRLKKWEQEEDIFESMHLNEQINKALDSKVLLPSGGSLEIDRTEAMTVIDVNTGKFTGTGGNLEETVTKNNLEAAEEIVKQLRLRDIGGIIVIDFIDMMLEVNRELVLSRLINCLSADRARHQVTEITSLGLVQMTRKRMGTGLLEMFSQSCSNCAGTGHIIYPEPVKYRKSGNNNFYETRKNFLKIEKTHKKNQKKLKILKVPEIGENDIQDISSKIKKQNKKRENKKDFSINQIPEVKVIHEDENIVVFGVDTLDN